MASTRPDRAMTTRRISRDRIERRSFPRAGHNLPQEISEAYAKAVLALG